MVASILTYYDTRIFKLGAEEILEKSVNDVIFGCFEALKCVHETIVSKMGTVLEKWTDHSTIGQVCKEKAIAKS